MGKNKRYKRVAKRLKGHCFENRMCCNLNSCEYGEVCGDLSTNCEDIIYFMNIRRLERLVKESEYPFEE